MSITLTVLDDFATFRSPLKILQHFGAYDDLLKGGASIEHVIRDVPDLGRDGDFPERPAVSECFSQMAVNDSGRMTVSSSVHS